MSFDVFAQAFRDGDAAFADAAAASAVLAEFRHDHEPEFNAYTIEFDDGSHLEMYADGLDGKEPFRSAMFALRGTGGCIGDFIYRFTKAAGCVLLPAMEPACVVLTDEGQSRHLPSDMADDFQIIAVSGGAELLSVLDGGYEGWRAYRNNVAGRAADRV